MNFGLIDDLLPVRHAGPLYRLVRGDSTELLWQLPPACVDLVFADPPYNLSNGGTTCQSGQRVKVDKGEWDASDGIVADHEFNHAWLRAVRHVLKPTGTLFVSGTQHVIFSLGFALQEQGWRILNVVTWFKPAAAPNLSCRMFTHSSELLIWATPVQKGQLRHKFNYAEMKAEAGGVQMRDVWGFDEQDDEPDGGHLIWKFNAPGQAEKTEGRHPTQKPSALLSRIIRCASDEGDVVLDPFHGSGTTGVEAVKRNRFYVGIDLDAQYLDLGVRRLARAQVSVGQPQ